MIDAGSMRSATLKLAVATMLASTSCQRAPEFQNPPSRLGGFVVQCFAVTDFAQRRTQCDPQLINATGGCACAQGIGPTGANFALPPLVDHEPTDALTFDEINCSSTFNSTCLPLVMPTSAPVGEFSLTGALIHAPDRIFRLVPGDIAVTLPTPADPSDPSTVATPFEVEQMTRSAKDEVARGCKLAHFGHLAEQIFGVRRPGLDWSTLTTSTALEYNPDTTLLHGEDLAHGGWGRAALPAGARYRDYVSHVKLSGPGQAREYCQAGLMHPFGFASVLGFTNPGLAGRPRPSMPSSPRIAPRQSVSLSEGSAGLLTISGIAPKTVALSGGIAIQLSECASDESSCTASLSSLVLSTSPFTIQNHNINSLQVKSIEVTQGVLQGNTLAFTSFEGTIEATLTDGRFDSIPVRSGNILARWDVPQRQFVMAFSFGATIDGTDISFDGTAIGQFDNTSPSAEIRVVTPHLQPSSDLATTECDGPLGTTVDFEGIGVDREESMLDVAWTDGMGSFVSQSRLLRLPNLALGDHPVQLMTYDSRGYAGEDRLTVRVTDTLPPLILASDICVSPPNHRAVRIRLGTEIHATSEDRCEGALDSVQIVGVVSSTGEGVVSWNDSEACVVAERSGVDADGRTYEVTLGVSDSSGHATSRVVRVVIPHNGPSNGCLKTHMLESCN